MLPDAPHRPLLRASLTAALLALACSLGWASAAIADSTQSTNWAGYAVHRNGVQFTQVAAAWQQPVVNCLPGPPTYSSVWVGLGGYSNSSQALEQVGTEADCSASGHEQSSAWYEMVPANSQTIRLHVAPGDKVAATVVVVGHTATLTLADLTSNLTFTRRVRASLIDTTSAEWIVEAPSLCSGSSCQTLPLADFGQTGFAFAGATQTGGHAGTIQDPAWDTTSISLFEGGRRFGGRGPQTQAVTAVPSTLTYDGSLFSVAFNGGPASAVVSAKALAPGDRLVHGARL